MIHLHVNRAFVHDMWCGLNIVRSPAGNTYTFDVSRVDCAACKEAIAAAKPGALEYAQAIGCGSPRPSPGG